MPQPPTLPDLPGDTRLRSGTAARLAGLPATTLRVWERRYGVVAAPRSASGQRLYSVPDVQRLAVLRQLTVHGHAIGTIAALPLPALQALAAHADPSAAAPAGLAVVGPELAHRLAASGTAPSHVYDDLTAAEAAAMEGVGLLLVHLPSLQPAPARRALALGKRRGAGVTLVYHFGPQALADSLRHEGATVLREPVDLRALAASWQRPGAAAPWPIAPRRFDDSALAALAALPSSVFCECPRHLAEIVAQLAGFEQYSAECGAHSPPDAALHAELHALAAAARTRFEQALAQVAAAEGLWPASPPPP